MRGGRRTGLLALVAGAVLVVGACAPTAPTAPGSPGASPAATAAVPRGGTLVVAIWQEPNTLNYFYATQTVAGLVLRVAVEGLVRTGSDGNYTAELAKEVPTLQNGGVKLTADGTKMDVTYKLLPDVKWSDGKPFTSADVKFTWQYVMKDPKVTSREGYDKIEGIDTPDNLTAVVHYKQIYAPYATVLDAIAPRHLLEGLEDVSKHEYVRLPLGTGPFKITEFKAADSITAVRNDLYRVKDRPYLDKIIFRSVPSREVAVAQLKAGEVDAMWNLLEAQVPELEKDANVKVVIGPSPSVERLEFNLAKPANPADPKVPHPVLGDIAVRKALTLATPKKQIIDKLLFGKADVANTTITQGWAAPKDVTQDGYDPAKAKQELDRAGWVPGSDGIRSKGGVRASLAITTTTGDKTREQVEQILIDEYKQVGIELKIKNVPSSVIFGSWAANSPRKRGDFDINMYASSPDIDPHDTVNGRFHSSQIPRVENSGAGFNYYRFSNPEADRLIDQAGSSVDQEQRRKLYAQVMKIVNDNYISVWLYARSGIDAYRANVGGYQHNPWRSLTWNVQEWWVRR